MAVRMSLDGFNQHALVGGWVKKNMLTKIFSTSKYRDKRDIICP